MKALYIIHPGSLVRLVLAAAKKFLSAKFWRKVIYFEDVNDIYQYIPRDQISFSNSVTRYNSTKNPTTPIFGSPLAIVLQIDKREKEEVPKIVTDCIEYLQNYLNVEGLFRKSGENRAIKELMLSYDLRKFYIF